MADVESSVEPGTVISKTVETKVSEDGTTVIEETTVVEVNGEPTKKETKTTTEVVEDAKTNGPASDEKPVEENGQVTKETPEEAPQSESNEKTATESEEAPAVAVSGGEGDVIEEEKKEESPPKVILHQFPPGKNVPSLSVFCLKLETFLRLNKIPYESQYGYKIGKKGKLPWIEYKGEKKYDSSMIINFLNEKFDVNVDAEFSSEQCALGRTVKSMLEENTYWTLVFNRFIDNFNEYKKIQAPASGGGIGFSVSMKMQQRKSRSNMDGHGIGRHSHDEIYQIANDDIAAVSQLLGDKDYILGDKPSSYDCTLFAFFGNVLYCGLESPLKTYIQENAKNIAPYCERIKDLCWQDWSEMVLGEKPEPALKKGFSFRKKKKTPKPAKEAAEKTEETPASTEEEAKTEASQEEGSQEETKPAEEAKPEDNEKTEQAAPTPESSEQETAADTSKDAEKAQE